jgi:TetR/AcrR family transcriptional regulator
MRRHSPAPVARSAPPSATAPARTARAPKTARPRKAAASPPRQAEPPVAAATTRGGDSRERIIEAALDEFSTRGFGGARVDRIARGAGLNKAMLYYHFRSKERLFQATVQRMMGLLAAHLELVANGPLPPLEKLDAFIETLITLVLGEPRFAPTMLREVAAGGARIDEATIGQMLRIVGTMATIVGEGRKSGDFRDVSPVLIYLTAVWPILVYAAIRPVRQRIAPHFPVDASFLEPEHFTRHMKDVIRRSLIVEPAAKPRTPAGSRHTEHES